MESNSTSQQRPNWRNIQPSQSGVCLQAYPQACESGSYWGIGGLYQVQASRGALAEESALPTKSTTQTPQSESAEKQGSRRPDVVCPRCGSDRIYRVAREGFVRQYLQSLFGYYPWRCRRCGATSMIRKRTKQRHHHSHHDAQKKVDARSADAPGLNLRG